MAMAVHGKLLCAWAIRPLHGLSESSNSPLDVSINTVLQGRKQTHRGWLSGLRLCS